MDYYAIKFALLVTALCFFLPRIRSRPHILVVFLILALALVPNSSIFSDERVLGGGLKLFIRYIFGILSFWDCFILIALFFIFFEKKRKLPIAQPNRYIYKISVIWLCGALIGILHATLFKYGYTTILSVAQQALPAFYFLVSLFITRYLIRTQENIPLILKYFQYCSLLIILEGSIFFFLASLEAIPVLRGYGGIPIVVYDGLAFLTFGLLVVYTKYITGQKCSLLDWFVFFGGIFFILVSTRRMNLLLLILNLIIIYLLTRKKLLSINSIVLFFKYVLFMFLPIVLLIYLTVPSFFDTFLFVLSSFDLGSEAGEESAGTFRLAQIANLFLNMNVEAPLSYVWGMGLGTQWYEFVPLVGINPDGDAGYIASLHELGSMGWWPYFHISNISVIYRFGLGGSIFILIFAVLWLRSWIKDIHHIENRFRAEALVIAILGFETLIVVGDSVDSAWPVLLGILIGILDVMLPKVAKITSNPPVQVARRAV